MDTSNPKGGLPKRFSEAPSGQTWIGAAQPVMESRHLAAFARACRGKGQRSVNRSWAKPVSDRTPIFEPIPGEPRFLLVIFVWRPSRHVAAMSVDTPVQGFVQEETRVRSLGARG